MQDMLSEMSTSSVVKVIRANWTEYYRHLGRAPKAELRDGPHLSWLLTGIPDTFNNVVFETQLPPERASDLIEQALDHFRTKNLARVAWWTEEGPQGAALKEQLVAHGLTFSEGATGMAVDLRALSKDLPRPAGLSITSVENRKTLEDWARVVNIGFGLPEWSERIWVDLFDDLTFALPLRSYLAILDGQPVGTSQLFVGAGVAGIYNVTCLPEARGRGVGAAITLEPLLAAREMGQHMAILQASHMGYGVYRRIGFQEYGRLNEYRWENETSRKEVESKQRTR